MKNTEKPFIAISHFCNEVLSDIFCDICYNA